MKNILAATVASLVVGNAMVASDTINFKGEITATACSITRGAGTTVGGAAGNQTTGVSLGKTSVDLPGGTAGGSIVGGISLNLSLNCGKTGIGLTTMKLELDPMLGISTDLHNESLLKLGKDFTATGVGIGTYGSDDELLSLLVNETIDAPSNSRVGEDGEGQGITPYSANLNPRAAYVKSGAAAATADVANDSLPFILEYN